MKKGVKWVLIGAILVVLVAVIAYPKLKPLFSSAEGGKATTSAGKGGRGGRSVNVAAVVIQRQEMSDKVRSTGTLVAEEEVDLSFETSGKVVQIEFTEGAHVKKGQLLAKVNDAQLQAQLQKLNAQRKLAEERLYRQKALLAKDAISQESYDQASTDAQALDADIALAKAKIAETELKAPFDGVIGLRYVSEGAYATPATKVARLIKLDPMKIDFSIPGQYANDIHKGDMVQFSIQVGDKLNSFNAPVYAIEPKVDVSTRSLMVRARYPNPKETLMPGTYAVVELTLAKTSNALAVPSEAIISEMGVSKVYLYKSGKSVATTIVAGTRTESQVQVLSGLSLGDTLITSGTLQLRDGSAVTLDSVKMELR